MFIFFIISAVGFGARLYFAFINLLYILCYVKGGHRQLCQTLPKSLVIEALLCVPMGHVEFIIERHD